MNQIKKKQCFLKRFSACGILDNYASQLFELEFFRLSYFLEKKYNTFELKNIFNFYFLDVFSAKQSSAELRIEGTCCEGLKMLLLLLPNINGLDPKSVDYDRECKKQKDAF
jgi:hypothetical protein